MTNANIFIISLCIFSFSGNAQVKKSTWTNKDKGTYIIYPHYMGFIPNDTTLTSIAVKFYELGEDGCKRMEGKLRINDTTYFVYDSTGFPDNEGDKDPGNYFAVYLKEGDYTLSASIDGSYYPVKTEKLLFNRKNSYEFNFFFVRKDALKKH